MTAFSDASFIFSKCFKCVTAVYFYNRYFYLYLCLKLSCVSEVLKVTSLAKI